LNEWLSLARSPRIVRRALKYAIGVGSVLILINHGDALLRGDIALVRVLRMILTVIVPYCVSTASSVSSILEHNNEVASQKLPY
jgi:hypothetical protein